VRRVALIAAFAVLSRCRCGSHAAADGGAAWLDAGADVSLARAADVEELWTRAVDGGDDELARLAEAEGVGGLEERATSPRHRVTALRAMAFAPGLSALPTLGGAAEHGSAEEARAAVDSADAIAARRRRPVDAEEEDELVAGCASLLAAAKNAARPREVRVGAVRALRMMVDLPRCVKASDIPADVDAK
jgi:hypothetical protein